MLVEDTGNKGTLDQIIKERLKPFVKKIDAEAYYAKDYLTELGTRGLLNSSGQVNSNILTNEMVIVEETAKKCMTTGFNLWCHLASLTYLRLSGNSHLKKAVLEPLENGGFLGGTGLSNPMKNYAGLEPLHLHATRITNGYFISGTLPSVSNLDGNHWFGIVASMEGEKQIMAFVPCHVKGLSMKEKAAYFGVNGSATFACKFDHVFIPDDWIISTDAQAFVESIRPSFVLYQIPLGLGVIASSIHSINKAHYKQGGNNQYLSIQANELEEEYELLHKKTYDIAQRKNLTEQWEEILRIRLEVVNLTMKAVHADMLHNGGAAYLQKSNPARRLREAYFLANLTPTVKHLEKLLAK